MKYLAETLDTLLLIFVVLKLTGLIDWSWRWVLSPAMIAVAIVSSITIVLYFQE